MQYYMLMARTMFRALYSLIQFTTITLLYSFASSLGDFQVSRPSVCGVGEPVLTSTQITVLVH